ncbi:MAG: hypothetical protein FD167_5760, partial [bacterium]
MRKLALEARFKYRPGAPRNSQEIEDRLYDAIHGRSRKNLREIAASSHTSSSEVRTNKRDNLPLYMFKGNLSAEIGPIALEDNIYTRSDKDALRIAKKVARKYNSIEGYAV